MLLKSIELSGFKSFQKKSLFNFSSPISSVVGPNGSGKSNVAEAFRFVLGEQSIKSLRGKKGEDLIWNGGADAPRSNMAIVKVVFDNTSKFLNIDFPEITIERIVHRDGVNEYLINGSQVRLKDVVELLATAHIGASGHHIISQGEADRILNANMKERREMIEDALGLKIYQYKRQESERKLKKTVENIEQVEALRKEIAPHLRFLKKQVEKLEKASQLKESLITLSKEYLKRESLYISASRKILNQKTTPLEVRKKELEEELSRAKKTLEGSKQKDEKRDKLINLEANIQKIRKDKDSELQNLGKIQGEVNSEERLNKRQREILSSNEHKIVTLGDVEELSNNIENIVSSTEKSTDTLFIKKILKDIVFLIRGFIKSKKEETNTDQVIELEKSLSRLKDEMGVVEGKLKQIEKEENNLQNQYIELRKEIEKEKDSNRDAEKTLFRVMSEENKVVGELNTLKSEVNRLKAVEEDFNREKEENIVLAGKEILEYESLSVGRDGLFINEDPSISEDRHFQEERRREIEKIKIRLEDSGLSGGDDFMKEYQETSERDVFLERELEDLEKSSLSLKKLIDELGEKIDTEFYSGVEKINSEFQKFFLLMFGGGTAELKIIKQKKKTALENLSYAEDIEELTEEDIKEEDGIDIHVSLPKKKIKGLVMLSGGERALTSIALLFAMSQVNPPPFIILDETDAALDEANSKKYGDMIEGLSKHSQLILITHNRETMSRAGIIYGVTMGRGGGSKVLSIQFDEAVAVAK